MEYTGGFSTDSMATIEHENTPHQHQTRNIGGGKFRLTYFDKLARWEESENIDSKVAIIMKERGTQRVAMDGLRGEGGKSDKRGGGPSNNVLGHGDINRPIQHQNIQNDNTIAASAPEYQKINPIQTRIEEGLDLNKDHMIKTRTVSDRDNTEVGLDFKTDKNPTQQQVPVHFLGGHNMVQYSGGLDKVPPHITIHQGFEEVPSNMGPYGQE